MIIPNDNFWKVFRATNGALSTAEAIAITNIAAQAPEGKYLELGTHKGKSAMAAMMGLKAGYFDLVDPEFSDMNWAQDVSWALGKISENKFNLLFISSYSTDIIENYTDLAYAMVDSGSHGDGLPMQEVKMLEDRIISGGVILFHDYKSQFVEVDQAYYYLLSTGKYEEISIDWEQINKYVKENNLEEGNQTWHHTELESPNFLGALKRK
jgi:hypothetical protein